MKNYIALQKHIDQISHLENIASIIHWDYAVTMPSGAAESRQQEMASLTGLAHEMFTANKTADLIALADEERQNLDQWQSTNIDRIKNNYDKAKCISDDLQNHHTIITNKCEFNWRTARANNDFNSLKPYLEEVVEVTKEVAAARASVMLSSSYDALLDIYDPWRKTNEIEKIYSELRNSLPSLIQQIMTKQNDEIVLPIKEKVSIAMQKQIGAKIIKSMGLSNRQSRLDESTHPFCGGTPFDIRMTTRYDEDNFLSSLYGVIHEAGHALYQANLPFSYKDQPVGRAAGMSFHESQSLIMEMQVGTSREFCQYLARMLKDEYGFTGLEYSDDNLYKILNRVKPGFIRVDSDEVTYPMHVILRFEIEKDLIEGNLSISDLPEVWNNKMQEYLGIRPETYSLGCLQDIHWPSGSFGYFPSYTNGAIIASMIMDKVKQTHSNIDINLKNGDFEPLNIFLNENLRALGSLYQSNELLYKATLHEEIRPSVYLNYLSNKYL